jgi:hypothetical protein
MRRIALLLSLLLVSAASFAPANAGSTLVYKAPGVGGFMSPNVTYVGTIPIDSPGIGGRMVQVGTQKRFYVTGARGLTVYDVTNPALPIPLGALEAPHWENEDVSVSADGNTVIISVEAGAMYVIDASALPVLKIVGTATFGGHTSSCVTPNCEWVYSSGGNIYDLRDKTKPVMISRKWNTGHRFNNQAVGVSGIHDLNLVGPNLVITDSTPRLVLDVTVPDTPKLLSLGKPNPGSVQNFSDPRLQHNSIRPNGDAWVPRDPANPADVADTNLRPGELFLGNSELNANTDCAMAGGFSTWTMRDFDKGVAMKQVEVFRPVRGKGDYDTDGNPAVNGLGCSGHWFTERNGIVAASWYEHGVRFLTYDAATGKNIRQLGYFQPVVTSASASHWVTAADGSEYVYSVDYARGIDILKFNRTAPVPTEEQFRASWLAKLGTIDPAAQAERMRCALGADK